MSYHLLSMKAVAAKKPHRCIWCSGQIPIGDIYYREASVYDGSHQNFAWHWDCRFDAIENYFKYGEEEFLRSEPG